MTSLHAGLNSDIGGHLLAALSSIMVLLLLTLQPLASRHVAYGDECYRKLIRTYSLFIVKDTEFTRDPLGVPKFGTVGINDTFSVCRHDHVVI
jgi:hypothetical protein